MERFTPVEDDEGEEGLGCACSETESHRSCSSNGSDSLSCAGESSLDPDLDEEEIVNARSINVLNKLVRHVRDPVKSQNSRFIGSLLCKFLNCNREREYVSLSIPRVDV